MDPYGNQYGAGYPPQQQGAYPPQQTGAYPPQPTGAYPPQQPAPYPDQSAVPPTGYGTQPPSGYGSQPTEGYGMQPPAGFATQPPAEYGSQAPTGYGTQAPAGYGTQPPVGYGTQAPVGYGTQPPAGYGTQPREGYGTQQPGYAGQGQVLGSSAYPPQQAPAGYAPQYFDANAFGYGSYTYTASSCHGKKRALLIGINYFGTASALRGCVNDVKNVKQFLTANFGFPDTPYSMLVLTDDQHDPNRKPTNANMIQGMRWLVDGAASGDSLFFHFSGHGGQKKDYDGDEDDGMDETILPCDYRTAGSIVDDKIHDIMVKNLPQGVRLTALFDSCHSGTAMDLPFVYDTYGTIIESPQNLSQKKAMKQQKKAKKAKKDKKGKKNKGSYGYGQGAYGGGDQRVMGSNQMQMTQTGSKQSWADVVMISGCRDDQTSSDATISGEATGAMSYAFVTTLNKSPHLTFSQLLTEMRNLLHNGKRKFTQVPQLSSGHPMDMNTQFIM